MAGMKEVSGNKTGENLAFVVIEVIKDWEALDQAVRSYDYEYKLRTFLSDLPQIRQQSLTVRTIQSGWRNAGLYPYNPPLVIDKIQETRNQTPDYEPFASYDLISTPKTSVQTIQAVKHWQKRVEAAFSSPSREGFQSFARGTTVVLHRAELYKTELDIVTLWSAEQKTAKARAWKSLQKGGQLYASDARLLREEKEAKLQAKAEARVAKESKQVVKQLQVQQQKIEIEERRVERKRVAERKKVGLKSKVIILRYGKDHSDSNIEISSDSSSGDSDSSSIDFII
ncbi:hypothetical protein VC83_08686 [Pseudogymnoascus destructans]|uniref:Uncharacterized protein n=1 Tax=Pseudogymnoascus destructans TaxID=655981 RepID=A0A176ZYB4_9PEZI|nr:uncharacterized protein VC83_08686 [Pseudogymnoascus destructans]OAF54837.1 hypothetical protein VC83_08686 [Pseudogymnoascus destructans]